MQVGSARHDEYGKYKGGKKGDQTGHEVETQAFYMHKLGWVVIRAKRTDMAIALANAMITACFNPNIGYAQDDRYGVVNNGVETKTKVNCDCSSLVRACIKKAANKDVGDFTTVSEMSVLKKSGLFEEPFIYKNEKDTPLFMGDILVTKTKGHTVIVTSGKKRKEDGYYKCYTGTSSSIVNALSSVGEKDTSYKHRKLIASSNGISNYSGTAKQNTTLLVLLKQGRLKKA